MDTVFIHGLRVETIIGVYEWERRVRQELVLDLELAFDCAAAASGDDIGAALDYAAVAARVSSLAESSEFQLIETLAERVATLILNEFQVQWLRLRLSKPGAVANAAAVGVVIERGDKA